MAVSAVIFAFMGFVPAYSYVMPGEELQYEVSFMGIKLCKILVTTTGNDKLGTIPVVKVKTKVETYNIPYVSFNGTFESIMDAALTHSYKFIVNSKLRKQPWEFQKVEFDYKSGKASHGKWQNNKNIYNNPFSISGKWNDPISLVFLTRQYASVKRKISIPTIMDIHKFKVSINLTGKKEHINIAALSYPIKSIYLTANADWKGVYGLSGLVEAWLSDDAAKVPLKAKVDLTIGNVTVELVKWKRQGWIPPK